MKKRMPMLLMALLLFPFTTLAETVVVEGESAKSMYNADMGKTQVLSQKNKSFILRAPNGNEIISPTTMTVKAGERFYILNEEEIFIHNVYDTSDSSWVLKKQLPSNIAAITFTTAGKHSLRCAIHPAMEVNVDVLP
jgi:plastocyanin